MDAQIEDFYSVLGVLPTATIDKIHYRASYKWLLAVKDTRSANPRLKLWLLTVISHAWEVLKDSGLRAEYDVRWQQVYGATNRTVMSGLPTPKESQPEPYNSYFDIPIETQIQYTSPPRIDPTQRAPNIRPNPHDFRVPDPPLEQCSEA